MARKATRSILIGGGASLYAATRRRVTDRFEQLGTRHGRPSGQCTGDDTSKGPLKCAAHVGYALPVREGEARKPGLAFPLTPRDPDADS
jgi:hypothetical protein